MWQTRALTVGGSLVRKRGRGKSCAYFARDVVDALMHRYTRSGPARGHLFAPQARSGRTVQFILVSCNQKAQALVSRKMARKRRHGNAGKRKHERFEKKRVSGKTRAEDWAEEDRETDLEGAQRRPPQRTQQG
eukprot:313172-Rhodomonas_salina.1